MDIYTRLIRAFYHLRETGSADMIILGAIDGTGKIVVIKPDGQQPYTIDPRINYEIYVKGQWYPVTDWWLSSCVATLQAELDRVAQTRRYDGIASVRSYAGYPNVFQVECIALGQWASNQMALAYAYLAQVQAGEAEMVLPSEVTAMLDPPPEGWR